MTLHKYEMASFKMFLESTDPLRDLEIALFFVKEFGVSHETGEELTQWVLGNIDAFDIETDQDVWSRIYDMVVKANIEYDPEFESQSQWDKEDAAREMIEDIMRTEYGIET